MLNLGSLTLLLLFRNLYNNCWCTSCVIHDRHRKTFSIRLKAEGMKAFWKHTEFHWFMCALSFRVMRCKSSLGNVVDNANRQLVSWNIQTPPLQNTFQSVQCYANTLKIMVPVTNRSFVHFRQPSESWSPPDDKCITYTCEKEVVTTIRKTICPEFNPEYCIPVSII